MRSHTRTVIVLAIALALVALFFYNVNLWGVMRAIAGARRPWLVVSLVTTFASLAIRSLRWKFLLAPLGETTFANAFRATAVGFAASAVLPARAGEVIRPYFLARQAPPGQQGRLTATGAFATIILERLLDIITVLGLLASFVFVFGANLALVNPTGFALLKWAGVSAAALAGTALVVLFVLAGDPARLGRAMARVERILPSKLAAMAAGIAEKFARGLGAIRHPARLLTALACSLPLWLCIALGIWAMAMAFRLTIPFTGSFLMIALLTLGVAVPTPGAVGGFHEAFRVGATSFYGAPEEAAVGAAIVLHLFSTVPSLVLGLFFAAQEGLNLGGMQRLADHGEPEHTA
jgi:glycosyltransferase 2 family protein